MTDSEQKKLAIVYDELLRALAEIEGGNSAMAKLNVLTAISFIDMIFTLKARSGHSSPESCR